jgi:hypothetical protein
MATMPAFLRRPAEPGPQPAPRKVQAQAGEFDLRALPLDDVFFFCKKINNERLVREADPRANTRCWSTIATACLALILLAGAASLRMANTLAGFRAEALKTQQAEMQRQIRSLEVRESLMLSPGNLQQVASERGLAAPAPGQIVHLEPKGEGVLAAVLPARGKGAE